MSEHLNKFKNKINEIRDDISLNAPRAKPDKHITKEMLLAIITDIENDAIKSIDIAIEQYLKYASKYHIGEIISNGNGKTFIHIKNIYMKDNSIAYEGDSLTKKLTIKKISKICTIMENDAVKIKNRPTNIIRSTIQSIAKLLLANYISEDEARRRMLETFTFMTGWSNLEDIGRERGTKKIIQLYNADGKKCFYCGIKTFISDEHPVRHDNAATIDHVLPKNLGGVDHIDNCVLSCLACNNIKNSHGIAPMTGAKEALKDRFKKLK